MKAGRVVTIRVNPKDCMASVDVVRKLGLVTTGMSFAQVVSLALSASLESLRRSGAVPTRDGFEFNELLAPFSYDSPRSRGRKLDITRLIESEAHLVAPTAQPDAPTEVDLQHAGKLRRYTELQDRENLRSEELKEFDQLERELFK